MSLYLDGKITGKRKPFPVKLFDAEYKENLTINSSEELFNLVEARYGERLKLPNAKVKLSDLLWNFGIDDLGAINLFDKRTEKLVDTYLRYRFQPHPHNNLPYLDTVKIMNTYDLHKVQF